MQYNLETLGDERFQHLCQALLTKAFPATQCLPVGQRDGGRDAFLSQQKNGKNHTTIFQVKYVRDPSTRDARDVILETIKTEAPKVNLLKSRGASSYFLLTNVSGSSYLGGGSVDRAASELASALDIDAHCWWRDDIERRIDGDPAIKWSYPEIIKATDLLQFLCNSQADEQINRRIETIRAFMAHQYKHDDKLKFKQIDLQKGISEMFVDVPARLIINEEQQRSQKWSKTVASWLEADRSISPEFLGLSDGHLHKETSQQGALRLLSDADFAHHFPLVVVEGAPGQGKSTITQFLCQVHRMMLLGRGEINKVSVDYRPRDLRIPLRVDLRDYASWVLGQDPFSDPPGNKRPLESHVVLESFLAALISRHTGRAFTVDDFAAVAKTSQILVVLDGFDEVADIHLRNRIVAEVSNAGTRISEDALSLQLVVTSRPAAFANSPGFPRDEFQYVELISLTQEVILDYSNKWLEGRDTDGREKSEIIRVLQEKLRQPHVRDLARNPMQLAILLNLISVRGASLPDKRTALYDSYIDIFLNREADKSSVVRDHRGVLLKIHRYLAWLLQMEAESLGNGGNISEARLKDVLLQFLHSEGHTTELVEELFQGVVERVFVLVSRVLGTFEFEVQPLREYFAARHLYDTAPYSPTGVIITGTLPERFIGLASNFYWLNVTRFFAGCYSSGELASLRYGLRHLAEDGRFKYISHISELTLTLLQDHVFSDQPLLGEEMTKWVIEEPSATLLLAKRTSFSEDILLSVPTGRPRDSLIHYLKQVIRSDTQSDRVYAACRSLVVNMETAEIYSFWLSCELAFNDENKWLWVGQILGAFEIMSVVEFQIFYSRYPQIAIRSLSSGRMDHLDQADDAWRTVLQYLLTGSAGMLPYRHSEPITDTGYFSIVVHRLLTVDQYDYERERNLDLPFWRHLFYPRFLTTFSDFSVERFSKGGAALFGEDSADLVRLVNSALQMPTREVYDNEPLWSAIYRECHRLFLTVGNVSARALSTIHLYNIETCPIDIEIDYIDDTIRYLVSIRHQTQTPKKLVSNISDLRNSGKNEYHITLLAALSFMSVEAIFDLQEELSNFVDELPDDDWLKISGSFAEIPFGRSGKRTTTRLRRTASIKVPSSPRLLSLIAARFSEKRISSLIAPILRRYRGNDDFIIQRTAPLISIEKTIRPEDLQSNLEFIRFAYGINKLPIYSFRHRHPEGSSSIPKECVEQVCNNANIYPLDLVDYCEKILTRDVGMEAVTLASVSAEGKWFST